MGGMAVQLDVCPGLIANGLRCVLTIMLRRAVPLDGRSTRSRAPLDSRLRGNDGHHAGMTGMLANSET